MRTIVLSVLALVATAPAQAQVIEPQEKPMSLGAQRAIRAALSVCVDWVKGDADYSRTPPKGFAKPNPILDASFRLGLGLSSTDPVPYWEDAQGINRPDALSIANLDGMCLVTSPIAFGPTSLENLSNDLVAAIKTHSPSLGRHNHISSKDSLGRTTHWFDFEGDRAISLMISYGCVAGTPTMGAFIASVRRQ